MTSFDSKLNRSLSLPLTILYGLGTIIGAGIYVLIGKVVVQAGIYVGVSFLISSIIVAFSAFSYAEFSSRFPQSGSEAIYIQKGFGFRSLSLVTGLLIILASVSSTATLANGFAGYFHQFSYAPDWLVITELLIFTGSVAAWGIKQSAWLVALITILEIGGLLLIIFSGLPHLFYQDYRFPQFIPPLNADVWVGILLGSFIAFYAFIGFEDIVNIADEVKNPKRNLPVAITVSLIISSLLYIAVALIAVLSVSTNELAHSGAPLALIYEKNIRSSPVIISVISLLSVVNGALVQIILASRMLYGLSRQRRLPVIFSKVSLVTKTPLLATFLVSILALVFALSLPLVTLAKISSFAILIVFTLVNWALWRIKTKEMIPPNGWNVPNWVPLFGMVCNVALLVHELIF